MCTRLKHPKRKPATIQRAEAVYIQHNSLVATSQAFQEKRCRGARMLFSALILLHTWCHVLFMSELHENYPVHVPRRRSRKKSRDFAQKKTNWAPWPHAGISSPSNRPNPLHSSRRRTNNSSLRSWRGYCIFQRPSKEKPPKVLENPVSTFFVNRNRQPVLHIVTTDYVTGTR